jgi:DNA modification methylase
LEIRDEIVETGLQVDLGGIGKRSAVRRQTLAARVLRAADIIEHSEGQWLVWHGLNDEGYELCKELDRRGVSCALIEGKDKDTEKINLERIWRAGEVRVLVTKPEIFGFGLNWQHCYQQVFLGIGDSYEKYYQAVRRSWRFGQTRAVDVRIVVSDVEGAIADNVRRKEEEARRMAENIVEAVRENQTGAVRAEREDQYEPQTAESNNWCMMLGDSIERIKELPDKFVGLSVFSPPFASLYTYSSSRRDLGNCKDYDQFFEHFSFLIPELLRVTMPGRRAAVHCAQVGLTKSAHGVIGWKDFRGDLIREFVKHGWIYDGEVCIDKNPQAQAIRTKSKQLMFVQKERDSSWLRPAMADYILLFRHPDENQVPVKTDVSNEEWIVFAHPIWYGIRESDVLKYRSAREEEDEKHICPLQLETIERCVRLWTNPGEVVLSPFAGIGSEGYVARRFGREFVGIELKESYWRSAVENLKLADGEGIQAPTVAVGIPEKKVAVG